MCCPSSRSSQYVHCYHIPHVTVPYQNGAETEMENAFWPSAGIRSLRFMSQISWLLLYLYTCRQTAWLFPKSAWRRSRCGPYNAPFSLQKQVPFCSVETDTSIKIFKGLLLAEYRAIEKSTVGILSPIRHAHPTQTQRQVCGTSCRQIRSETEISEGTVFPSMKSS